MNVSEIVGRWYDVNKRILPWREDKNPYKVWLSEIILQQTRVQQGTPYYQKFIARYPTIKNLAEASIEEVLVLWQGLGYYSRARNMHKAAQLILTIYNGEFPSDYKTIHALPGVGDYSAAAIASLAYNLPYAAIDGNVYRVLSRYLGINSPIDTATGKKQFLEAADRLLDRMNPGRHNQAMIELGALVCLPKSPLCDECPLQESCFARINNCIDTLPVKSKKVTTRHRYFFYMIIKAGNKLLIRQRPEGDIWALLFEFPLIEKATKMSVEELIISNEWTQLITNLKNPVIRTISEELQHVLSHQKLHTRFIHIEADEVVNASKMNLIEKDTIEEYPFPQLIRKYLANNSAFN